MSIVHKINNYNAMVSFINQYDIGKPKKRTHRSWDNYLNAILWKFANDNEIKGLVKDNKPNYKGSYSPVLSNAGIIQDNWKLFRIWIIKNYKKL